MGAMATGISDITPANQHSYKMFHVANTLRSEEIVPTAGHCLSTTLELKLPVICH